eukprot:Platyproteum_vivax@DN3073_c0_g1_i2.p1
MDKKERLTEAEMKEMNTKSDDPEVVKSLIKKRSHKLLNDWLKNAEAETHRLTAAKAPNDKNSKRVMEDLKHRSAAYEKQLKQFRKLIDGTSTQRITENTRLASIMEDVEPVSQQQMTTDEE